MHSIWMEAGVVNLPSISVALHNLSNYKLINIKFVRQTFLVLLLIITFLISLYPYSAHFAMYLRVMPSVIQCDSRESAREWTIEKIEQHLCEISQPLAVKILLLSIAQIYDIKW